MTDTCTECSALLIRRREDYRYKESGLLNVILENVEVRHCEVCKSTGAVIPRITDVYTTIAVALMQKTTLLNSTEVRFLRKFLNWTEEQLGSHLGMEPWAIHVWEVGGGNIWEQAMPDRLLRMIVAHQARRYEDMVRVLRRMQDVMTGTMSIRLSYLETNRSWWAVMDES